MSEWAKQQRAVAKRDLSIVEAMGLANGNDAAADFLVDLAKGEFGIHTDKAVTDLLDPNAGEHHEAHSFVSDQAEPDRDEVEEMLRMVADKLGTGIDSTMIDNYCKAFEQGFEARVLRDAVALVID